MDVLPGRYTSEWFEATKPGEYHLFCDQYCGTQHSRMVGKVTVLDARGLPGVAERGPSADETPDQAGRTCSAVQLRQLPQPGGAHDGQPVRQQGRRLGGRREADEWWPTIRTSATRS